MTRPRCGARIDPHTARYSRYDYCRIFVKAEGERCHHHRGRPDIRVHRTWDEVKEKRNEG